MQKNFSTSLHTLLIFSFFIALFHKIEGIPDTPNEEAVFEQLISITNPTQEQFIFLSQFLQLDLEEQQIALIQLSALPYTNIFQMSELTTRKFLRRLYDPLRQIVAINPSDQCDCVSEFISDIWFDIGYDKTHVNPSNCFDGFSWKGYDLSFGIQTSLTPCWTFGLAGSYERDTINYRLDAKGKNQSYLGGIYSLLRPSDSYILADVVFGCSTYSVNRPIEIGSLHSQSKGSPQVYQGLFYLEAGHDLPIYGCCNTYLFQPFLGLETGYFRYRSFRENGNHLFNMSVSGRSHVTFSGRLGMHFSTKLFSCVSVAADAAWQHRCTSLDNHISEHFHDFGNSFSITGLHLSRDSFDGAVNLAFWMQDNFRIYIEAAGQIWSKASTYNTFAGIQCGW